MVGRFTLFERGNGANGRGRTALLPCYNKSWGAVATATVRSGLGVDLGEKLRKKGK